VTLLEEDVSAATDSRPDDALGNRIRRGAMWTASGTLVMRLGNIAVMAIVARTLSQEEFGVFAVAATVYAIVSSIAELGVASAVARADVDADDIGPTTATISIISGCAFAAIMLALADPLASALGSAQGAAPIRVMAIAVFLVGVVAVPGVQLQREFAQDRLFVGNMVGFVVGNGLLLLLAKHGVGAMSFAWSRVIAQFTVGLVWVILLEKHYRPGFRRHTAKFVLAFGLPLAGANLLNYILLNADYAFVGHLLGPVELGTYVLAFNVASWPVSVLSSVVNGIALPAFSRVKDDAKALETALKHGTTSLVLIAAPISALTAALATPLVRVLYGQKWLAASPVLAPLTLYGSISVLCLLFANVLSGFGDTRRLFYAQIPWLCALIPAMAFGIELDGITGAAWAHIVVICLVALPVYVIMLKRTTSTSLRPMVRAAAFPILAALAGGVVAALVSSVMPTPFVQLVVGGAAGGLLYVVLVARQLRLVLPGRAGRVLGGYIDRRQHKGRHVYRPGMVRSDW
jgi:lipopolysaccharide exporter